MNAFLLIINTKLNVRFALNLFDVEHYLLGTGMDTNLLESGPAIFENCWPTLHLC